MIQGVLLGVCGFMGSGKDTLGDYLIERYGYQKASFAGPLKETLKRIFDFTDEQVYGKHKEIPDTRYRFTGKCVLCGTKMNWNASSGAGVCPNDGWAYEHEHVTPRLAMQTLGTEWGRRLYDNIWVDACMNDVRSRGQDNVVITDVRFRNEVQAVQDAGGLVIRLRRGELSSDHASEAELAGMEDKEFDLVVDNQGTLEDFYAQIEAFMPHVLSEKYPPT